MFGLAKFMKSRPVVLLFLILAVLTVGLVYNYSEKFIPSEPMETSDEDTMEEETVVEKKATEEKSNTVNSQKPCDLLPKPASGSNGWDILDTVGTSIGANPDLLEAGYHAGIDTIGQSLRNANLQVRSDPPIPIVNTGPWNQSTIEPTNLQVPFNLGDCSI